jgi:BirA family biotin operon repressor/biotin-[acetyl-CoA-carboxylase] ligase
MFQDLKSLPPYLRIGDPFIVLDSVDSTNNYAMGKVNAHAISEGTAYFAEAQTSGKGQRGKSWESDRGSNMLLSVVLQPVMLNPENQFPLSAGAALAASDLLMQYCQTEDCTIKWTNDIYWRDRKAGGILIENVLRGNTWIYGIIGIGINVNQQTFSPALPNPVSLSQITGKHLDPQTLARQFCEKLESWYGILQKDGPRKVLAEYGARLFRLNRPTLFREGTETFEGIIRGVGSDGKLILETEAGNKEFGFGSLEFVG